MALEPETKAPDFEAATDGGSSVSLSDFTGKWVVLYFYPKDMTPGCTQEACDFRDNMERITSFGAVVLGVSPDQTDSHEKFIDKYALNFRLIADTDKKICESYDIFGKKTMFGKSVFGLIRTTYIIDPDGIIKHVFSNVKVSGHVDNVIKKLIAFTGQS